jgi:hypothetical protein
MHIYKEKKIRSFKHLKGIKKSSRRLLSKGKVLT